MASIALFLGATLLPAAVAQFVAAPSNLTTKKGYAGIDVRYKEVPSGICETVPGVKSYSGYADVDENQHIFWWFFEARNQDPKDAPLTVWINGGPGSSSMIGLFQENGPCRIDDNYNVIMNPYSWNNVSNMLFIDEPTQVGFSYSIPIPGYISNDDEGYVIELPNNTCPDYATPDTCGTYSYPNETLTANSTMAAAPNFWKTLQGFMGAFPQYSRNGFHFTTESYGGHYGPVFNEYIETQNANLPPGAHEIHLETVAIGNGWYNPLIQYQAYYNFTVYPGNTYDYSPFNETIQDMMYNQLYGPGNCVDQQLDCDANGSDETCLAADNFCYYEVEYVLDAYANRDEYDIRELMPDPFPPTFYVDYLNTASVQAAIGAYVNYTESNTAVYNAFESTGDDSRLDATVADLQALLKQGIYFMQYAGDADYNCNWLGGQVVADEIDAPGYSSAGFTNISTSDDVVHGQVKQSGSYAFVRIYESGHEVPFYQPLASLAIFERNLKKLDIATGLVNITSGYKTTGPATSDYREGISTVQFEVVPTDCVYNTTTNEPNPCNATNSADASSSKRMTFLGNDAKKPAAKRSATMGQRKRSRSNRARLMGKKLQK